MDIKNINIKKILIAVCWVLVGGATIILSVAAMQRQSAKLCKGIEVTISGVNNNFFIDKNDVLRIINDSTYGHAKGLAVSAFNLRKLEAAIKKDVWVKNAELFFDNNDVLQANIEEREPVARIFTGTNNSFYIDSSAAMLPLSDKFSARLPVFTGFTSDAKVLSKPDSNLLLGIRKLSLALQADSFLMAMIDQVDITPDRNFEMTPKIGNQVIMFGDAVNVDAKFKKLKLFYKEVIMKAGWSRYSTIDLQYDGQVVARIRGKEDVAADSLRTFQLMNFMAKNAAMEAADSAKHFVPDVDNSAGDIRSIQQSEERDEGSEDDNSTTLPVENKPAPSVIMPKPASTLTIKPVIKLVIKPAAAKPVITKLVIKKPAATKPAVVTKPAAAAQKKPAVPAQKPKAVMPKNEY